MAWGGASPSAQDPDSSCVARLVQRAAARDLQTSKGQADATTFSPTSEKTAEAPRKRFELNSTEKKIIKKSQVQRFLKLTLRLSGGTRKSDQL